MDEGSIGEDLAMALGEALIRKGVLDADDLSAAADRAKSEEVAHLLRVMVLNAEMPSQAQWEAEKRRQRMRLVKGDGE